jgi:hypothetical protein
VPCWQGFDLAPPVASRSPAHALLKQGLLRD